MTIRPPWGKLWQKKPVFADYSVSPVHDVEDDVDEETDTGGGTDGGTVVLEGVVTGITAEYPASEPVYTQEGDNVSAKVTI